MLSDLAPLERLGLKVYDLPTYADLDEVVNNPSFFGSRYGITFTNVTDPAWTGNFTDPTSGTLAPGANTICSLTACIRPRWRSILRPISRITSWPRRPWREFDGSFARRDVGPRGP